MKTGTIWCWLFGHKFIKNFKVAGAPGYNDIPQGYVQTFSEITKHCVRCGIDK